jgi:hypothetical protein
MKLYSPNSHGYKHFLPVTETSLGVLQIIRDTRREGGGSTKCHAYFFLLFKTLFSKLLEGKFLSQSKIRLQKILSFYYFIIFQSNLSLRISYQKSNRGLESAKKVSRIIWMDPYNRVWLYFNWQSTAIWQNLNILKIKKAIKCPFLTGGDQMSSLCYKAVKWPATKCPAN